MRYVERRRILSCELSGNESATADSRKSEASLPPRVRQGNFRAEMGLERKLPLVPGPESALRLLCPCVRRTVDPNSGVIYC